MLNTDIGIDDEEFSCNSGDDSGDNAADFCDGDPPPARDGEMIESYDKQELIAAATTAAAADDAEPYEGMAFDGEDAARAFYQAYSARSGFRARISRCHRSARDGSIISRCFVCSREGFYARQNPQSNKRIRPASRTGCLAMLLVKRESSGRWLVHRFVREHNHELAAPRKMDVKPCIAPKTEAIAEITVRKEIAAPAPNREPQEGMQFQSEDAARGFYYAYAHDLGFTVRVSKCRRARDGSIIHRRFVCSKEGYYVRKFGRTKRSRELTRVGCLAGLVVKRVDSGIWVVAGFQKEHNHPPFQELSYLPPMPTSNSYSAALPATGALPHCTNANPQMSENSLTWRFNKLHEEGIQFAEEGAISVEIFNVAMLALREASEKVAAAKIKAAMVPLLGSGSSAADSNRANWSSNTSNHPGSKNGMEAAPCNELMLGQQSLNFVVMASGLSSGTGQSPVVIQSPLGQAHDRSENQSINVTVPHTIQKQLSLDSHSLEGNGPASSGMSEGREEQFKEAESDVENFITVHDYNEEGSEQQQGWNAVPMSQPGSDSGKGATSATVNTNSLALSETQVAALRAVAEAFNISTMKATSTSALPIPALAVPNELSGDEKGCLAAHGTPAFQSFEMSSHHQYMNSPPHSGPNPLVHAAAIAAGARIAPPSVAASLIKAVQSRTTAHIKSGGMPRVSSSLGPMDSLPLLSGGHQISNIHYFRTGEPSIPLSGGDGANTGDHRTPFTETAGLQSATTSEQDQTMMMYHCMDFGEQLA